MAQLADLFADNPDVIFCSNSMNFDIEVMARLMQTNEV